MPFGTPLGTKGRSASSATQATSAIAVASGSTIIVGVAWTGTSTFTSLVDNAGNTYTIIGADIPIDSGGTNHARQYQCQNCVGNAALVITLTLSGAASIEVLAVAVPGAAIASLDQSNAATDAATPFGSGNVTTTQAREMLVSIMFGNSGSNPATHAESTGFSIVAAAEETNGASFWTGATGTRLVTSVGTYAASWTESGGASAAVFIVSLKEAADGGGARRGLGPSGGPRKNRLRSTRSFTSAVGGDVTLALTGVAGTGAVGNVGVAHSNALTGNAGTGAVGNVTPNLSIALTGVVGTGAVGDVAPSMTIGLTGVAATGAVGSVSAGGDLTLALTGVSATGAVGTLTPATTVALTGNAATGAVGTLAVAHTNATTGNAATGAVGTLAPSTTIGLTGNSATGQVGTVTVGGSPDVTLALTGVAGTGAAGTVGVAHDNAITGNAGTSAVGTVGVAHSNALTGNAATGAAGSLAPSATIALTGVAGTGQVGTVSVASSDITIALTGVSATGQVGNVSPSGGDVVAPVAGTASGGGSNHFIRPLTHQQKKRKDKKLEDDIRRIYRRLVNADPEITSLAEAIVEPITSPPAKKTSKAVEVEHRAAQLTAARVSVDTEIALRLAEQELETKRAQRAENMKRIQLILQLVV